MADTSTIEWTDATWNPIAGCSIVSPGCTNCYAMRRVAPRLAANPATPHYAGTVQPSKAGPVWTGKIGIASDAVLLKPLHWRQPKMIFVNSTSDLFHPGVPDAVIDRIFAVMALCPQHIFQVLTKRPERMREYLATESVGLSDRDAGGGPSLAARSRVLLEIGSRHGAERLAGFTWPLPNVWLGSSVEDQQRADERIPHLLATPAAVRFISAEPLLGPIDLRNLRRCTECGNTPHQLWERDPLADPTKPWLGNRCPLHYVDDSCDGVLQGLDWVIVGGESGTGARPMHPDWARSLRDQCATAGVPFFFKQWGEWLPMSHYRGSEAFADLTKHFWQPTDNEDAAIAALVGKHAAGRLLDGVEHNGMPK